MEASSTTYLVVPPGQHHVVQPTMRLIDPVFGGVYFVVSVRIVLERFGIYDLVREFAADNW